MTITRRGLLGAILATGVAPYVSKAGILMPVRKLALPGEMEFNDIAAALFSIKNFRLIASSTFTVSGGPTDRVFTSNLPKPRRTPWTLLSTMTIEPGLR